MTEIDIDIYCVCSLQQLQACFSGVLPTPKTFGLHCYSCEINNDLASCIHESQASSSLACLLSQHFLEDIAPSRT